MSITPSSPGRARSALRIATLQRRVLLATWLVALVCWIGLGRAGHGWLGLFGAMLLVGGPAIVLALEQLLAAWQHGSDPTPRPSARQRLRAWWVEVGYCTAVFSWRQPFFEHAQADDLRPTGRRGIVLVHGYCCNRAFWHPWRQRLQDASVPHVSVSLTPIFASIDSYAAQLDEAVQRLHATTGLAPVLVCHSMGGLVARAWWRWRMRLAADQPTTAGGLPAHHILTIGSPHAGTWLARCARPINARQVQLDSPWLQALAAEESDVLRTRMTCIYSHCDNIVFPPSTAVLPGTTALHLEGLAHLELAYDPRVLALALQLTQEPALP
jgi:hypothetical protein